MKTFSSKRINAASGFTMTEILVVMAIIAVLAAMTIAGLDAVNQKTNEKRTTVLLGGLENALEAYKLDNGEFPEGDGSRSSSIEVYKALHADYDLDGRSDKSETIYFDKLDPYAKGKKLNVLRKDGFIIVDAWQNPFYYQSPGNENPDFDLWSLGADEAGGPNSASDETKDDITNY